MAEQYVRVRYVKSSIGYNKKQKDTVRSLGLRKLGQEKVHRMTDSLIGMCQSVRHLVAWEVVDASEAEATEN